MTSTGYPPAYAHRLWAKVEKTETCWIWTGTVSKYGYGIITYGGRFLRAHRVAYELEIGAVPTEMHVHHECGTKLCVNPAHLSVLSPSEHSSIHASGRSAKGRKLTPATHCKRGHEFTPENTYVRPSGKRICKACRLVRNRRFDATRSPR